MSNKPVFVVRRTGQSDDELYHWKYIDKFKNAAGEWQYVYKKAENAVKSAIGINQKNAMNKSAANLTTARRAATIANLSKKATINKSEKAKVDAAAKLQKELAKPSLIGHNKKVRTLNETRQYGNKEDVDKASQRAMETGNAYRKANKDYAEKKSAYDKSLLGKLDKAGDSIKKTAKNAGKTLDKWGDKAESAAKKGIKDAKKGIGNAIEDAKDKLGFDEREAYREASNKHDIAKKAANRSKQMIKATYKLQGEAGSKMIDAIYGDKWISKPKVDKTTKKYQDRLDQHTKAKNVNRKLQAKKGLAVIEKSKKASEYYKTPIGKIDKAGQSVKKGMNKVNKALKRLRGLFD